MWQQITGSPGVLSASSSSPPESPVHGEMLFLERTAAVAIMMHDGQETTAGHLNRGRRQPSAHRPCFMSPICPPSLPVLLHSLPPTRTVATGGTQIPTEYIIRCLSFGILEASSSCLSWNTLSKVMSCSGHFQAYQPCFTSDPPDSHVAAATSWEVWTVDGNAGESFRSQEGRT